jgi:hypothetical protein
VLMQILENPLHQVAPRTGAWIETSSWMGQCRDL